MSGAARQLAAGYFFEGMISKRGGRFSGW
jgi:hypothetical protein